MTDYRKLFDLPHITFQPGSLYGEIIPPEQTVRTIDPATVGRTVPPAESKPELTLAPARHRPKMPIPDNVRCPKCHGRDNLISQGSEKRGRHARRRRWWCTRCEKIAYALTASVAIGKWPESTGSRKGRK